MSSLPDSSPAPQSEPAPPAPVAHLPRVVALFGGSLAAALMVYGRTLTAFPFLDDLSDLRMVGHPGARGIDCFRPMGNAFWRPLGYLYVHGLYLLFGSWRPGFHAASLLLLATASALSGLIAMRLMGQRLAIGFTVAAVVILHPGLVEAAYFSSACFDIILTLGFLLMLLGWTADLQPDKTRSRAGPAALTCAGAGIALLGKEHGALAPLLLAAWWPLSGVPLRTRGALLGGITAACGLVTIYRLSLLRRASGTYFDSGQAGFAPVKMLRGYIDHLTSVFYPFLHAVEPPGTPMLLSSTSLHVIRAAVLAATLAAGFVLARLAFRSIGKRDFLGLACFVSILVVLIPAALWRGQPQARYLTASIPFLALLLTWAAYRVSERWRRRAMAGLWIAVACLTLAFALSPHVPHLLNVSRRVEACAREMQRLAPSWPEPARIVILDQPHPGAVPWNSIYCQHLAFLYLRGRTVTVDLWENPKADRLYRFVDPHLVPIDRPAPQ